MSRPTATALAVAFVAGLEEHLTVAEWREMQRRNRTSVYHGLCASHDFCDSNMVLYDAFVDLHDRDPDISEGSRDMDEWRSAWTIAKVLWLS